MHATSHFQWSLQRKIESKVSYVAEARWHRGPLMLDFFIFGLSLVNFSSPRNIGPGTSCPFFLLLHSSIASQCSSHFCPLLCCALASVICSKTKPDSWSQPMMQNSFGPIWSFCALNRNRTALWVKSSIQAATVECWTLIISHFLPLYHQMFYFILGSWTISRSWDELQPKPAFSFFFLFHFFLSTCRWNCSTCRYEVNMRKISTQSSVAKDWHSHAAVMRAKTSRNQTVFKLAPFNLSSSGSA